VNGRVVFRTPDREDGKRSLALKCSAKVKGDIEIYFLRAKDNREGISIDASRSFENKADEHRF
jgi:hypothetical protein